MKITIPFIRQEGLARIDTLALLEFTILSTKALKAFRAQGPIEVSVLNFFKQTLTKWLDKEGENIGDFNIGDYALYDKRFMADCRHEFLNQGIRSCKLVFCDEIDTDVRSFDESLIKRS